MAKLKIDSIAELAMDAGIIKRLATNGEIFVDLGMHKFNTSVMTNSISLREPLSVMANFISLRGPLVEVQNNKGKYSYRYIGQNASWKPCSKLMLEGWLSGNILTAHWKHYANNYEEAMEKLRNEREK